MAELMKNPVNMMDSLEKPSTANQDALSRKYMMDKVQELLDDVIKNKKPINLDSDFVNNKSISDDSIKNMFSNGMVPFDKIEAIISKAKEFGDQLNSKPLIEALTQNNREITNAFEELGISKDSKDGKEMIEFYNETQKEIVLSLVKEISVLENKIEEQEIDKDDFADREM